MTTGDIATLLYNKKLIQTPDSFRMAARLKGLENHLQAGTYEITAGMSDGEIINILSKGKVHSNRFAVPEGATVNEVALKLEREHLDHRPGIQGCLSELCSLSLYADQQPGCGLQGGRVPLPGHL